MIIETWADEFSGVGSTDPDVAREVDLHLADTAVAFFAGCHAPEAQALARHFTGLGSNLANEAAAAAAMIRRTECDDIHIGSCITPGSVVIPVALALTAGRDGSADRFSRAVEAGYAVGLRLGAALGGAAALATGIWPTYFAAPMMAAATASACLGLDAGQFASALGLAAAGAGGHAGRPSGSPSGRWLAIGEAVGKGCRAAMAAAEGFRGDPRIISAEWLAALARPQHIRPEALTGGGAVRSVGLKPFVAARQTTNAVVAFQEILKRQKRPRTIERVEIAVPTINAGMVARAPSRDDRLSTIASMHVQIAAAALRPDLLYDVERAGEPTADLTAFAKYISIIPDPALNSYLPDVWAARVRVLAGGQVFDELRIRIPGDPGARDEAVTVIRNKLVRMVPEAHRDLCTSLLGPAAGDASRNALWQAMSGIIHGA